MSTSARLATVVFLATAALAPATAALRAQDVLIHEVYADGADRWIELHNRGAAPVDLSQWSLYYATHTPLLPQNYWWGFPSGTTIAADGYLRVHWYGVAPANPAPNELYTGTWIYGFLFGFGCEPLDGQRGALGLYDSQNSALMNGASALRDWVSWGDDGFNREALAVTAGLWTTGVHAPAIPPGESLARDISAIGTVASHDLEWFLDPTPTPLQPNLSGALLQDYGVACQPPGSHLLGVPTLQANSMPLLGNAQFGFTVANTTGIYGEVALVAFSAGAAPPGLPSVLPPIAGGTCREVIDPLQLLGLWLLPTQIVQTGVPLSLAGLSPALAGAELHVEVLVLDLLPFAWPPYEGVSNGLRVVLGQ